MLLDGQRFFAFRQGPVTAVASWQATSQQLELALPPYQAHRILADLGRDSSRDVLIELFTIAKRTEPDPLRGMETGTLVAGIDSALESGQLLFLEGWDSDGATGRPRIESADSGTPEERLVRRVMNGRSRITFQGCRYLLVPASFWFRGAQRNDYRIVPIGEARTIVTGMSGQSAGSAQEGAPWNELLERLSDRRADSGVLLLLHKPQSAGSAPRMGEPAVTPSQLRPKVAEDHWIELKIVYDDGSPFEGNCSIELPDGRKTDGPPGKGGVIRIDGLTPGSCKVSFPDLHQIVGQAAADPIGVANVAALEDVTAILADLPVVADTATPADEAEALADLPGVAYAATLEDEAGTFLDGVELSFAVGGANSNLTSADGQAGLDSAPAGGATVSLVSPKRVKAALKKNRQDRAAQGIEPAPGEADPSKIEMIVSDDDVAPASVPVAADATVQLVLKLAPASVSLVELEDDFFRTASAVVLPDDGSPRPATDAAIPTSATVLASALRFAQDNPDKRALVAGHTDSVAAKDFNQALSEDRALAALACLRGDRAVFQDVCDRRHLVSDIKQILAWAADTFGFLCDPGAVDENGATAVEPIRRFQNGYNGDRDELSPGAAAIAEDGSVGPETWGAVFDCYEFHLADQLVDSSDPDERRQRLQDIRGALAFVDDSRPSQGFGETQPVEAVGQDSVRSQANRRVEFLFFDDDELPSLDGPPETSEVYLPGRFVRVPVPPEDAIKRSIVSICLYDDLNAPLANAQFRLTVGSAITVGQTPDGFIEADAPPDTAQCLVEWSRPEDPGLTLADGTPRYSLTVSLTGLDPSTDDGASAILGNLGYDGSELDGNLLLFQSDQKLAENGQLDAPTQAALGSRHTFLANGTKAG